MPMSSERMFPSLDQNLGLFSTLSFALLDSLLEPSPGYNAQLITLTLRVIGPPQGVPCLDEFLTARKALLDVLHDAWDATSPGPTGVQRYAWYQAACRLKTAKAIARETLA